MAVKKEFAMRDLYARFTDFVNLVLEQLDILEKLIVSGELHISDEVLNKLNENEKRLDDYEIKMSDAIIETIVLQNPVASDLREIMAMNQMVSNLERIGDSIVNISQSIQKIKDQKIYAAMSEVISNMLFSGISMVKKSVESFIKRDKEAAIWTIENDDVIDEMNHKLIKKAISRSGLSKDMQHTLTTYIQLSNIISTIERIADHSTNVAEASIYSLEGHDIRHSGFEANLKNNNADFKS